MKFLVPAAAIIAAATSVSAHAQEISGPRVEVFAGYDQQSFPYDLGLKLKGMTYGGSLGYDYPVTSSISVGVDAEISNSTARFHSHDDYSDFSRYAGRDYYVGGRITARVSQHVNVYGTVGYTNVWDSAYVDQRPANANPYRTQYRYDLNGYRLAAGVQIPVTRHAYGTLAYRYSHYQDQLTRHQVLAGLGYRF